MIKSDAQLERTRVQIEGFRRAIQESGGQEAIPLAAREAIKASHEGMIAKLEAEIRVYEDLRRGKVRLPRMTSTLDLGRHLVAFRIAQRISQEQLAEMVGLSRQTINKHEEQAYQLASVELLTQVGEALRLLPEIIVRHKTLEVLQPV